MRKTHTLVRTLVIATTLPFLAGGTLLAGGVECGGKAAKHSMSDEIFTVEGDVQKPKRTGGPVPAYPESAKEDRVEGTVVTRLLIEKDGAVSDARIEQSLGDDFDRLALEAVRQWTFEPASVDGEPVRVYYNITINYRLDGDETDA